MHTIKVYSLTCYDCFSSTPGPYYQLSLACDYFEQGENRKTVNVVRKMIRTYVKEQEAQGRVFEHHRITTSYWLLHEDTLDLIAPWLDRPVDLLKREANIEREKIAKMRAAQEELWKFREAAYQEEYRQWYSLFGHGSDVNDALRVLDLQHTATAEEIKKRYRKLAMQHHPDTGGDVEQFKRVSNAYRVLQAWKESA